MENSTNKLTLKIYSTLFVVFALIDIVKAIIAAFQGDFNPENIAFAYNISTGFASGVIIISVVLIIITFAIEMFLGIRGLQSAESTKPSGKAHIIIAKIILIPVLIALAFHALSLFTNISSASVMDWLNLSTPIAATIIVFGYISAAKKVLHD